jgi:hypothetical protein
MTLMTRPRLSMNHDKGFHVPMPPVSITTNTALGPQASSPHTGAPTLRSEPPERHRRFPVGLLAESLRRRCHRAALHEHVKEGAFREAAGAGPRDSGAGRSSLARPRRSDGWTLGRRTYWAGLAGMRPSM